MGRGGGAGRRPEFATRAVHGWRGGPPVLEEPASPPIYQTSTFLFEDLDALAAIPQTRISGGYLYSRWANPTVDALSRLVADLEDAEAAACFGSGMAAIHAAITSLATAGDHVVAAAQVYGGTHSLLADVLPRYGIDVTRVDITDLAAVEGAIRERTRLLYAETIGNPTLPVADIARLSAIAGAYGAALVLDATFTTPFLCRPLALGADLVVHSATKYLAGHGDVTGGVVAGNGEAVERIRQLQIDTGGILAPFEAWLTLRGIGTLPLRMERICSTALTLAHALEAHPGVERVHYPGLPSHPAHELAARLFGGRFGGMLAIEVTGGRAAGRRVMERVRIASPGASLGGTKTLVVHPASVTHTQLSPEELRAAGIGEGMVRVSVGIEDPADLTHDLTRAVGTVTGP